MAAAARASACFSSRKRERQGTEREPRRRSLYGEKKKMKLDRIHFRRLFFQFDSLLSSLSTRAPLTQRNPRRAPSRFPAHACCWLSRERNRKKREEV